MHSQRTVVRFPPNRCEWRRRVKEAVLDVLITLLRWLRLYPQGHPEDIDVNDRLAPSPISLVCDFSRLMSFVGTSKAGLINHMRERHQQGCSSILHVCAENSFHYQGMHNHQLILSQQTSLHPKTVSWPAPPLP